jgi:hypothetical protein
MEFGCDAQGWKRGLIQDRVERGILMTVTLKLYYPIVSYKGQYQQQVEKPYRTFSSQLRNVFLLLTPTLFDSSVPAKEVTEQAVKWQNTNSLCLKISKNANTD